MGRELPPDKTLGPSSPQCPEQCHGQCGAFEGLESSVRKCVAQHLAGRTTQSSAAAIRGKEDTEAGQEVLGLHLQQAMGSVRQGCAEQSGEQS